MNADDIQKLQATKARYIKTSELREGDILKHNGAIMRCGAFKSEPIPDDDPAGGAGDCRWCTAEVLDFGSGDIPPSWCGPADKPTWQIQGNDRASWGLVYREEDK